MQIFAAVAGCHKYNNYLVLFYILTALHSQHSPGRATNTQNATKINNNI